MEGSAQQASRWHAESAARVAERLGTSVASGLTGDEAAARLARHGPNRLLRRPPKPGWRLFLEQFKSLLIVVLLVASVLAAVVGDAKDAIVILVVVLLNAFLGFRQEHQAEAAVAALERMLVGKARVRRGGTVEEVDVEQIVPGDVVLMEGGDRIPADGRVVESHSVEVDESALTGESHAVEKRAGDVLPEETPLAERVNFAFMNSVATRGRLELLVTETGMNTQMGKLAGMLEDAGPAATPLQVDLDRLGKRLALVAVSVVSVVLAIDVLRGEPLLKEVMDAIALAVAAIPEGLPAVVTVTLALGMQRMARNRAIVKKLSAVETLGCTTVICSDKTGTLTMNQMTARAVWFQGQRLSVSGDSYSDQGEIRGQGPGAIDLGPLALTAALCNDAQIRDGALVGDPTEGALLGLALKAGVDPRSLAEQLPRVEEIPFDSATKLMATFHRDAGQVRVLVKGAPDVLLARSTRVHAADGVELLDDERRRVISVESERMASQAMRVLAVADRSIDASELQPESASRLVAELTFLGLIGIVDPPRPEARVAVARCARAGVSVKMITGDQKATAVAIASEVGVTGQVLTGSEIEAMSDADLIAAAPSAGVFARVSPEHKLRIVRALQESGHVVAMTGDGVNDAPAVKTADIGIAMGKTGTEVTKEAAAMVLADDNFATIVGAVEEGRTIYDNIVKFVRFQLSTNIGAVLTVAGASFLGLPSPFTAIQLLWINIIMDGPPAMTLGLDPPRPGIMTEPPRKRSDAILTWRRFLALLFYGSVMAVGTLLAFRHGLAEGGERYGLTLAFTTFVLFQIFNVFNARAEGHSALTRASLRNSRLWLALAAVLLLQVVVVMWAPARLLFGTEALSLRDWLLAGAIASGVLVAEEARKLCVKLVRPGSASGVGASA
ncbi:MAG: cation-translocating P-type ATPase [Polyangiaceae bacterium]|nr:cation-translocating P-type ATPase [Polyangiaceae bacterium]